MPKIASTYVPIRIDTTTTKKLYMKASATWDDTARGHNLVLTGSGYACEATSNTACPYVAVTTTPGRPTIDSNDWTPSSIGGLNNLDRYFTDYTGTPNCYSTGSLTQRCYGTGNTLGCRIIIDDVVKAEHVSHEVNAFTYCVLKGA